jgi:hypothetical protein
VSEDHGVPVHVDDPGVRCGLLGDPVNVVPIGYPGADVQELADAQLSGQMPYGRGQEGALGAHHGPRPVDAAR